MATRTTRFTADIDKVSATEKKWKSIEFFDQWEKSGSRNMYVMEPPVSSRSYAFKKHFDEDESEFLYEPRIERRNIKENLHFYEIGHAVRVLLRCDITITIVQLALLLDRPLDQPYGQNAFRIHGGYDLIINLLEVNECRCNIGALQIIKKLASTKSSILLLTNMGVITPMVKLLSKGDVETQTHVAITLTELFQVYKPARYFRKEGGIPVLLDCLDISETLLYTRRHLLTQEQRDVVDLGTAAAHALTKVAKYSINLKTIHKSGLLFVVKKVVNSCHRNLLIHTFLLLEMCAKRDGVRLAIETDGVLLPLLQGLKRDDDDLRAACASTIAQCAAESELSRHIVRLLRGLTPIVTYVADLSQPLNTMFALVFAATKLAQESRNLLLMSKCGLVKSLIAIIKRLGVLEKCESDIVAMALEGLAESARMEENRRVIDTSDVIETVVGMLYAHNATLVLATAQCLGTCARSEKLAQDIIDLDGIRLLLNAVRLYSDKADVCATALWALRPIVQNSPDSAEEFRNIMGGFGLLIETLKTNDDPSVLGQACGLVAEVAQNYENRQILTDRGVVRAIADCTDAAKDDKEVVKTMCEAISVLSNVEENQKEFGMLGMVILCRDALLTHNFEQHLFAMEALAALTRNAYNCIVLHEAGGLDPVLHDVASPSHELQEFAMIVVNNMRQVALNAEKKAIEKCSFGKLTRKYESIRPRQVNDIIRFQKQYKELHLAVKKSLAFTTFSSKS